MEENSCDTYHIEEVRKSLCEVFLADIFAVYSLCHVLAAVADIAVEDVSTLVEREFGHMSLIFEDSLFSFFFEFLLGGK